MSWRDDNQQFFDEMSEGKVRPADNGPCELCARFCPRCNIPVHQHTQAGLIECAWRGYPCLNCGQPPHPDYAPGRCDRYTHPADTLAGREIRGRTPWRRDARGPFYVWRHCNHRRHDRPETEDPRRVYEIKWPEPYRPPRSDDELQRMAAEQAAGNE
jgi:hypothetical protein